MAEHRAEQILKRVVNVVTNLPTTGANVIRGRVYPFAEDVAAGLSITQGPDVPVDDDSRPWHLIDSVLEVYIDMHVKDSSQKIDVVLNQIRVEITQALQGDPTLALDFVIDLDELGADEPEESGESDKPTAVQRTRWAYKYRRSRTDPSA